MKTLARLALLLASVSLAAPETALEFLKPTGPAPGVGVHAYGGRSSTTRGTDKSEGSTVVFHADDHDYSGLQIVLPADANLAAIRDRSLLELRVRSVHGGERLFANLVDGQGDEPDAGVQSRQSFDLPASPNAWTTVRIPLWQFPATGLRYSNAKKTLSSGAMDWKRVRAFYLTADKGANERAAGTEGLVRIELATVRVVVDPLQVAKPDIDAPGLGARTAGNAAVSFVQDAPPPASWDYNYGGTTRALWVDDLRTGRGALLYHGDDREYSGWTLHLDKPVDLTGCLAQGVLKFRLRGRRGGERVIVGLLDVPADGSDRKSQVRVDLSRRVVPRTKWQEISIPLAEFGNTGLWWDDKRKQEIPARLDWSRIQEFRISSDRGANASTRDSTGVFEAQFADVRVERDAPPPWDPKAHWAAFKSNAAPVAVFDSLHPPVTVPVPLAGMDWVKADSIPLKVADWSHHAALRVRTRSAQEHRIAMLHLVDSSGETWSTSFAIPDGVASTTVPFSRFLRNPSLQNPSARADGRMDLEKVRMAFFVPGWVDMGERTRLEKMELVNDLREVDGGAIPSVRLNTVGYRPESTKRFLSAANDRSFALLDSTGKSVLVGDLVPSGWWEAARESLWVGDFGRWTRPGTYRVAVGREKSDPFRIGNDVYDSLARSSVKAFTYQRAEPLGAWAGIWARGAHTDTGLRTLEIPGGPAKWSAPGGWYDAGDYGKYVVNAGITVWSLLALDQISRDSAARAEAKFEVDWLERMQDKDGGVMFKIASRRWSRFVLPGNDSLERFVIGKSTTSSLDFAATLAQSARACSKKDPARSTRLLEKARKAYAWASSRAFVPAPDETGGSGSYEDPSADDEFAWAATEIWLASGKAPDRIEAAKRLSKTDFAAAPDWPHVQDLALVSLALSDRKDSLVETARARVERLSDSVHEAIERSAAREPLEGFPWGSNSLLLNHAIVLVASHHLGGNAERLSDAQELLDYVLGRNALGRSFVTGFGANSPRHPHLRPLGTGRPVMLGYLVGGPNPGRQDELSKEPDGVVYPWTEDARSYVDRIDAYAGNEVSINWNASLAFVVGYLARQGR